MVEGREKRKALAEKEYNDTLAAIDKEERDTLAKLEKSRKAGRKVTPEEERQVKDGATAQRALAQVQYLQNTYNIEKRNGATRTARHGLTIIKNMVLTRTSALPLHRIIR